MKLNVYNDVSRDLDPDEDMIGYRIEDIWNVDDQSNEMFQSIYTPVMSFIMEWRVLHEARH